MSKITKKFLPLTLSIFFSISSAFAISSEFKNSLVKMEMTKVSEGNYSVDLYTKNKFSDPVKIIKKSDSNYYILLPETRNEMGRAIQPNADIKSAGVISNPYAGQDVNNGYIKIDINTTKPINFNVNVKSISAAAPTPTLAKKVDTQEKNKEVQAEVQKKTQTQEKNTTYNSSKTYTKTGKKTQPKQTKVVKPQVVAPLKIEPPIAEIKEVVPDKAPEFSQEIKEEIELPPLPIQIGAHDPQLNEDVSKLKEIKTSKTVSSSANGYINFLIPSFFVFGLLFIFFAAIRTQRAAQIKLLSRANMLGIDFSKIKKSKNIKKKQKGLFFMFNNGIQQNALLEPITKTDDKEDEIQIEEEIVACEPIEQEVSVEPIEEIKQEEQPTSFEEVMNEAQEIQQTQQIQEQKEVQVASSPIEKTEIIPPIVQEIQQNQEIAQNSENPDFKVLSSVEISPKRGFMCVQYNNKVSLMGYILDDVFVLHNFKRRARQNFDIQYRLSDKIGKEFFYIVKVGETKMLIKSSKTNITREVVL